eukprot:5535196-Amphidinium_carterae.1
MTEVSDSDASAASQNHLCCSSNKVVNPAVALTVLEVLYSYVHMMRAFNGDWQWDALQAASHFLHLAPSLAEHRVYGSCRDCLSAALTTASSLPGGGFGASLDSLCLSD